MGASVDLSPELPVDYCLKKYLQKKGGEKEYQHNVPDDYEHMGRWWGLLGIKPQPERGLLTVSEFNAARRTLRKWRRAQSKGRRKVQVQSRGAGMFVVTRREGVLRTQGVLSGLLRVIADAGSERVRDAYRPGKMIGRNQARHDALDRLFAEARKPRLKRWLWKEDERENRRRYLEEQAMIWEARQQDAEWQAEIKRLGQESVERLRARAREQAPDLYPKMCSS